ncbi:Acylpyruvase FAHD1, mitochondrial [Smittium culicis]|uniref:Acylpyruvase FAHD1, mitochondrial n=1 Tax=Smittium culicis TaxID=133412 RepID=A0A1R1Y937_9FUNG|nr:Acylpyruvase FAHD1, mitochondrial [Smittium culicis]
MRNSFLKTGKKIVAIGKNYVDHAKEFNSKVPTEPMFFLKPTTSYLLSPNTISLPKNQLVHHEIELGFVMKNNANKVQSGNVKADDLIEGFCLGFDLTARDLQSFAKKNGYPWTVAKGYNHFCPISSLIDNSSFSPERENLSVSQILDNIDKGHYKLVASVNSTVKQDDNLNLMVFKIPELISYVSNIMTLEAGDMVLTGTPKGVGPIQSGDVITGQLINVIDNSEVCRIDFSVE